MKRKNGILLHISSLPSRFGIGDMGPWAYRFVDFLSETGQSFWQILPINPTPPNGDPYHGLSAFAGNTLLISPEIMVQEGLLAVEEIEPVSSLPDDRVDYSQVVSYKEELFERAYDRFNDKKGEKYEEFCAENSDWLEDFALFSTLKDYFEEKTWTSWPKEIRDKREKTMEKLEKKHRRKIAKEKFLQYVFFRQWSSLKRYCNKRGIKIFGDLPIYLSYESADVWSNPEIFKLDEEKKPSVVSGVPPDAFSDTGQLWGHPIYKWEKLKEQNYDWWSRRFDHNLKLFDWLRLDHFRGYVAYWEVSSDEETAVNGEWVEGPAEELFPILLDRYPKAVFIAEDLGEITPDVIEVRDKFGFPGMEVLIFGFEEDFPNNPHLPHNYRKNSLACTGTHDTNTIRGWLENEATAEEKERIYRYIGRGLAVEKVQWELLRLVMMSRADLVSIPMQDLLGLGEGARMNRPAGNGNNWRWRLSPNQLNTSVKHRLETFTKTYGRMKER